MRMDGVHIAGIACALKVLRLLAGEGKGIHSF